jgi:hypothetical protein
MVLPTVRLDRRLLALPSDFGRKALDHPVDHPDDPTEPFLIRLDRRGTQREQARSVWSRPDRRRAPGYGSGGLAMAVLADAAPCGPVPGRTSKRQWTVPLPAVQPAAAAVSACPCRSRAGVHRAGRLRVAGVRRPRPLSERPDRRCLPAAPTWPATEGCPRHRTPRQCPLDVRNCGQMVLAGRLLSAADTAAPLSRAGDMAMAVAGGRPSMHAPPATAVDASRRRRCLRRQPNLDAGGCPDQGVRRTASAAACGHGGNVRGASGTAAAWRWCPDGWCPSRTPPPPARVRCYRNRSPDRWLLNRCCSHRR